MSDDRTVNGVSVNKSYLVSINVVPSYTGYELIRVPITTKARA